MIDPEFKKVDKIIFGLISPKEIKKMACAKIVTPELYDKEGYPVDGGLMDIRLGVIDPGIRCKTCGGKLKECMGHFGYIEFARPLIHIKYVRIIHNILRSTCKSCCRILLSEEDINDYNSKIEKMIRKKMISSYRNLTKDINDKLKNIKKCPHCNEKQGAIKLGKPTDFYDNDKKISPVEIRTRFEKISDDDVLLMGLNPNYARPENMILTFLQIPPVTIRPSITLESGERSEDDLTHKLGDIVRINQRLFENINAGAPEVIIEDLWDLLQYHVTTYFDNTLTSIPPARHRSGQPLKTLVERIKSKEGRFRHNLAGKRVNFAARTVISPDANIKLNEVGVPLSVAMDLTIPERVTEWNIKRLKEFIKRGSEIYPGSNYVINLDGKKKKITDETKEQLIEELECSYIVERHLMDGDIAIFNRQPSLHRMSIMGHKIKVLPGKSFRLNPTVCNPYNADFDGDEMNLHIPQNEEAMAEAEILMQVQTQIITPKNGMNVIGCIEDAVSGNYLLTKEMKLTKDVAVDLLIRSGADNLIKLKNLKTNPTGKDVFSVVLPNKFDFIGTSKACRKCEKCKKKNCDIDAYVLIKKGELICGTIDSNTIGEGNGTLIRAIHREFEEDETLDIMGKIFKLGVNNLLKRGFTTGISDTDLPQDIQEKIDRLLNRGIEEVESEINKFESHAKFESLPGKTKKETVELMILQILNKVRNKIGKIVADNSKEDNPTIIMAKSGAKGNLLNLAQMSACVGQQALRGKRIERGYEDRTLPIFKKNDLSPDAHGFIKKGFKSGLNPYEFFFGAMTGRDSLMDTALRTPKSGYLYRRLSNALQDLKIEYDFTMRNANKKIIQFSYGEDNMDVSKSEGGTINVKKIVKDVIGG